jgi:hypothetical protein
MAASRARLLLIPLTISLAACTDCEDLNAFPVGNVEPPILDLGPVPLGEECEARLDVVNSGRAVLEVGQPELADMAGEWVLRQSPSLVNPGDIGEALVTYTSGGTVGERQSVTVEFPTNDPQADDGIIRGVITALPTDDVAGVAVAKCDGKDADGNDVRFDDCPELNFGAVQKNNPGLPPDQQPGRRNLHVDVVNTGNADFQLQAIVINGGDGDFTVEAVQKGNTLVDYPWESNAGPTLNPGRASACEPPREESCVAADQCNVISVDILYTPTALGADAAELVIFTNAAEGAELNVPLSGTGADVGIALLPDVLNFTGVGEGDSRTDEVRVLNFGTNEAPVNTSCIDVGGDGTCDGDCTGGDDDKVEGGTLGCNVKKADGGNEGKGFVLEPTDAQEGGEDERIIEVTWAPVAGNASIPAGTVLRLETSILDDRVYEVPLGGGGAGVLALELDAGDQCGELVCIQATGDAGDTMTWVGSVDFTLKNTGDATMSITGIDFEETAGVDDDFTLTDTSDNAINATSPGITLAPDASTTLRVAYSNNDASQQDLINLVIEHDGLGGEQIIPFNVLPPQ